MAKRNVVPVSEIEAYLIRKYHFRKNTVTDRVEFAEKKKKAFSQLTEKDINSLYRELHLADIACSLSTLKSLLNSDFIKDVDPFSTYFDSLQKWKASDPDYIHQLADTIETSAPETWQQFLKKWIVGVVACAINPEKINHQVLVLVGKQGVGKSTWLNKLLPAQLTGYLYAGIVNPNNKDTLINLSENLLINLDELENLNKSELGSLKALITQSAIRVRKAYGVFNENFVRRASFMGSVNDAEFLTDTTGNRRYLCFTCKSINYSHEVNIDDVYAQAYALYKSGKFKYWFDQDEIAVIDKINDEYLRVSIEEELLLKYFRKPISEQEGIWMTTTEIAIYIKDQSRVEVVQPPADKKFGAALKKHGFKRTSKNNGKPFWVCKLKMENPKINTATVYQNSDYFPECPENAQSITDFPNFGKNGK